MSEVAARLAVVDGTPAGAEVLERYERLAADLLTAYESGDPQALQRIQEHFRHTLPWDALRDAIRRRLALISGSDPATSFIHIGDARLLLARDAGFKDWPEFEAALLGKPPATRGYNIDAKEKKLRPLRTLSPEEWDTAIEAIAERRLESIEADGRVTDAVLARIASLRTVTSLNLEGCRNITDDGLRHLARMPQLRSLNLTGCSITDAGLLVLRGLPELRSLTINHHPITDAGAANMGTCSLLERVSLMGTATGDGPSTGCSLTLDHIRHGSPKRRSMRSLTTDPTGRTPCAVRTARTSSAACALVRLTKYRWTMLSGTGRSRESVL